MTADPNDAYDSLVQRMTNEQLVAVTRRNTRLLRLGFVVTAAALLAGVWVDWRFLPTALAPGLLTASWSYTAVRLNAEVSNRLKQLNNTEHG